jgi:hypothetical protein
VTLPIVQASSDFVSGAPLDEKLGSRGYGPAAGVALVLIFVAPFFDWRRPLPSAPFRPAGAAPFGVSHRFLNRAELDVSAPLAYAVLLYALVRALVAGFGPHRGYGRLVPRVPATWLAIMKELRKRMAVDRPADLDEAAGSEELDRVRHHHIGPTPLCSGSSEALRRIACSGTSHSPCIGPF